MTNSLMVKSLGDERPTLALRVPPIQARRPRIWGWKRSSARSVPPFEPYPEQLPLQSGYYSYVIDAEGRFYVKRGNTTSHAGMVGSARAIAGGRFYANRLGRVTEVFCGCRDYGFYSGDELHAVVSYVTRVFEDHPAFNTSPHAVFRFHGKHGDSLDLSTPGKLLSPEEAAQARERGILEGAEKKLESSYSDSQIRAYASYSPALPPRCHTMRLDQAIICVEEPTASDRDTDSFDYGPPAPRFDPTQAIAEGKNNFIIDESGWLIIGVTGHQLLSGGQPVGGAGHVIFQPNGSVGALELNFSGHYRPDLTAEYARYVYRTIRDHPLILLEEDCKLAGRKFKDCDAISSVIRFDKEDLESDDEKLDWFLESLEFD